MPKKPPRTPEFDEMVRDFGENDLDFDEMDLDQEEGQDYFMSFEYDTPLIGRRRELHALGELVCAKGRRTVVLHGPKGIGKSRLAAEVVAAYGEGFDGIYWVDCSDCVSVPDQIARCVNSPEDPLVNVPVPLLAKMVRDGWNAMRRVLVVFDHCDLEDIYEDWFPQNGSALVVCHRRPRYKHRYFALDLPSREDSVALITSHDKSISAQDADRLADGLNDEPIALILAASYLAQVRPKLSVDTYLKRFEGRALPKGRFPDGLSESSSQSEHREARLVRALMGSLEWLQANKTHQIKGINLLAGMLHTAAGVPVSWAPFFGKSLGGTVRFLGKLGLLEVLKDGQVSISSSMWVVLRTLIASDVQDKAQEKLGRAALKVARELNKEGDVYSFREHLALMDNLALALLMDHRFDPGYELAKELIKYHVMTDNEDNVIYWHKKVMEYFMQADPKHGRILLWRYEEASYYLDAERYDKAGPLLKDLYVDAVHRYGADYWLPLLVCCKLGVALKEVGQMQDALSCLTTGMAGELFLLTQDEAKIKFFPHTADCHHALGDSELALAQLEEVRALLEAKPDRDEDALIECCVQTAEFLSDSGQLEKARDMMVQVIGKQGERYGFTAPELMGSRIFLSDILHGLGDDDMALAMLQAVHDTATQHFRADDPFVIGVASRLGKLLIEMEDYDEAQRLLEDALSQVPRKAVDEVVAVLRSNLGQLYLALEQPQKAIVHLKKALEAGRASYPPNHPEMSTHLSNLGAVHLELGQPEKARKLLAEALKLDQKLYEADHPSLLAQRMGLARALFELGRLDEARIHLKAVITSSSQDSGDDVMIACHAFEALAYVELKAGHSQKALALVEEARAMAVSFFGEDHEELAVFDAFIDQVHALEAQSPQRKNPSKKVKGKSKKKSEPFAGQTQNGGVVIPFPGGKNR